MKRIAVLLLCLCMILPMAFVMVFSAGATTVATEAPLVSTDKAVYLPGEEIKVTATKTVDGSWVGIVPADKDGNPIISQGTIYWENIPAEGLTDLSIKGHNAISGGKADTLAGLMSVSKDEMLNLCAGRYFMAHISSPNGIVAATNEDPDLVTYVPFTVADKITMEKTTFTYGEDILVTPVYKNVETDYVGISHVKDDGTIGQNLYYTYITDANLNTPIAIQDGVLYGSDAEKYGRLPAGRYVVYFAPNNAGAGSRDKSSDIYIDVVGATVEKTEFKYGEPIMVTGYGAGKDWIGISQYDASTASGYWSNGSIRWRYIEPVDGKSAAQNGFGSGVAFDIREAHLAAAAAARGDLPVGDYVIFVGLDDCYAVDVSPYTEIHISITADAPDAPSGVTYALNDDRTGLAGGKLTVTFAEASMALHKKPTSVELYWADAEGNALADYGKIGNRKITGATTEIELTDSMVIPAEAKKLMVRAFNGAGYATEAVAADVPEHGYRTTGDKVTSFQIVSDMHIGGGQGSIDHANMMFADIMALDPDSVGIFVAGDAADHGQEAEYQQLFDLWAASGLEAKLYIGVGNHEMMKDTSGHGYNDDYAAQVNRFMSFANQSLEAAEQTETPYYYVNRGGQHFIFLATEYCGTHAYLSDAQLAWLESKLAEVAADGAPVFIMLHQGLYNSVAGTLGNAEGTVKQGWDGVIAGDENFEAWKTESGNNLSDHGKMKGQYEAPLREILAEYPSAMMFSGHSHWIMESLGNIHEATEAQPNYLFNTASVSYLWTDHDQINGGEGTDEGSQGYFVTVYENCIEFRGRDFVNGTWIPGAYYRVWLDCAHEGDTLCDTTCKWCGETNTNAVPCDGEFACSVKCIYCGEDSVEDAVPCAGATDCATTCQYGCGNTVFPTARHEGEFDCSATCAACGEDMEPVSDHVADEMLCSGKCALCGEVKFTPAPHEGAKACSTVCQYGCGENVTATADHDPEFECSATCDVCGEAVEPAEHKGAKPCDTVCGYGCGTEIEAEADHTGLYECSDVCQWCNAPVTPAPHEGAAACASTCKYGCGTFIFPTARHEGALPCSDKCAACGADIEPKAAHEGAEACSTLCKYGCGEAVTPTADHQQSDVLCSGKCSVCDEVAYEPAEHVGLHDCSDKCRYCDIDIDPIAPHSGDKPCDAVCKECGIDIEPASAHTGEHDCSTTCQWCLIEITPVTTVHNQPNPCDTNCADCGAAIDHEEHTGLHTCSPVCQWCGTAIADPAAHQAEFACSENCAVCGEAITPEAEHTQNGVLCSELCAICGEAKFEAVAHEGDKSCSTVCKYGCETTVVPTDDHTAAYECSANCSVCGEGIGHAEHEGEHACSTVCKYGCGTVLTPDVAHTAAFDCSESCAVCGEAITPVNGHTNSIACSTYCDVCGATVETETAHTATAACSTACSVCGEALEPTAEHTTNYACDTNCIVCNEEIAHEEHDGEFDCSTVCKYGCGTVIEDAVACVGAIACEDTTCRYCGAEVEPLVHDGAYSCSTVCKYGCGTAVKPDNNREHRKENGCATVCMICGEAVAKAPHDYDNSCDVDCNECGFVRVTEHRFTNSCDAECDVCGETRTPPKAHTYAGACDTTCEICHTEREADAHTFDGACDTVCNVCGQTREKGEHLFGDWTVVTEATTEAAGLEERACRVCGVTESREVPKLTVDPNAADDLNKAPTLNLPVIGEVDRNTFIIVAVAAGAALLVLIIVIAVIVSKKKKKKKAAKAEEAEEGKDEVEITDQAFEESNEEAAEGEEAEKTEEAAEATEEAETAEEAEATEEATEADETKNKDEE